MLKQAELISPKLLEFDSKNPRILEFGLGEKPNEKELVKLLWATMGIEEIIMSIRSSGFFQNEPLIAVKENGKNIVIEGNRRLAALRCLTDPKVIEYLGLGANKFSLDENLKKSIDNIPVVFVDDRKEAWKFIGFKHINGPAKWGSYAKAQYIFEIKKTYGLSLQEIASQLGDTHRTVHKLYQALIILNQAEKLKKFDLTDISSSRLYFSHLYTAITYEGYRDYLGINNQDENDNEPVPREKYDNLEQLLLWLFGSKKHSILPIIRSQNPDLKNLEKVLKNNDSIRALKNNHSLDFALELSIPKDSSLINSLDEAKIYLSKALSLSVEGFDGKDKGVLMKVGTIIEISEQIYDILEKKYEEVNNKGSRKKRLTENGL